MSLKEAKGRRSWVFVLSFLKSIDGSSRGGGDVGIAPHDLSFSDALSERFPRFVGRPENTLYRFPGFP
jgi:hypothetical protein